MFYRAVLGSLRWLFLSAVVLAGCDDDLGSVPARVEAVEVRSSRTRPVAAVAYSFEFNRQRYVDTDDAPQDRRRPEVGDTITVRVRSTNPIRSEIVSVPSSALPPLSSSSGRAR